uniref:hypothetical protein n=1 Tax=Umezakia ovalisporum TaxID=75695 RepID=UPI0039C747E2
LDGMPPAFADTSGAFSAAGVVADFGALYQVRNSLVMGYPAASWILADSLSAARLNFGQSAFTSSVFQCADTARAFYIRPGVYGQYGPVDFREFVLRVQFRNRYVQSANALGLADPFNFSSPQPWPAANSILLGGADFSGPVFSNGFFSQVSFVGALNAESWLAGWTNFTPLKTSYNEPR